MGKFRKYGVPAVLAILLTACQGPQSFLNATSPIAAHEADLYRDLFFEALAIFILITGALIWILIRYRHRGDQTLPAQVHGRVSWIMIPVFLIVALDGFDFVLMLETMNSVAIPAHAASDINIRVVGHRWWWEFDYPDLGIVTANELHIPVGTDIQVALESADVIHSFWVPKISGKTDVIPGQHNTMWLHGSEEGTFYGQCAEFCGTEHAMMRFIVVVQSQADFDAWVKNQQALPPEPQTEDQKAAVTILTSTCKECHSLNPAEPELKKGPNLAHLFSRSVFAGGSYDLNEQNLRSWLKNTQTMKPGNDMEIQLTPKEIDELISYFELLK